MTWLRRLFAWGDDRREAEVPPAPPGAVPVHVVGDPAAEASRPSLPLLLQAAGFREADAWALVLAPEMQKRQIVGSARVSAFLATIAHESEGGRAMVEGMRYSAERLMQVWPRRFPTLDAARPYAWDASDPDREDILLANATYGGRMGNEANGTDDDDGWRYRGRGLVGLTGAAGYGEAGDALGLPLLTQPDLAAERAPAAAIAAWWWQSRGCNELADTGPIEAWRRRVNGGLIGLPDVRRRRDAVLAAWAGI